MRTKLSAISRQRSAKEVVTLSLSKHLVVHGRARLPHTTAASPLRVGCPGAPRHYLVAPLCAGLPTPHSVRPKVSPTPSDVETYRSGRTARSGDRHRTLTVFATLLALTLHALTCSAATLVTTSVDGGGQRTTSANYTMDGSVGGIAGISTVASPPETVKAGYIGQLTEVASLSVTGSPPSVNEGATSLLTCMATLDDATLVALAGADVNWSSSGVPYPLSGINASGVATAAIVYQNTAATVYGYYLGVTGNTALQVLDLNTDNYGIYAGDNIPDWWQVQYFGVNNPNGVGGADADGTGQNNLFKYVAGLDPTNPASIFILKIAPVTGQPNQKKLTFLPWASARTYTPQYRLDLSSGSFATLPGYSGPTTNGNQVSVTDLNATESRKFYRIKITYP